MTRQKFGIPIVLFSWYLALSLWAAYAPIDREFWLLASILPTIFVLVLIATHRWIPFSCASYTLIAVFLTMHVIGVHYTYAQVPMGGWIEYVLPVSRNHYDRIVHFGFGFLLTYPMEELLRLSTGVRGWLLYYLPVITVLGLSGLWEMIESWVAQAFHPELGLTYLGSQGDLWDAQRDMAAALYGSLLCVAILLLMRRVRTCLQQAGADPLAESSR